MKIGKSEKEQSSKCGIESSAKILSSLLETSGKKSDDGGKRTKKSRETQEGNEEEIKVRCDDYVSFSASNGKLITQSFAKKIIRSRC